MTFAAAAWCFAVGCGGAILATPVLARLAVRWSVVDRPDGNRKGQAAPTPLGGGVAVLFATLLALGSVMFLGPGSAVAASSTSMLAGLLPAALVLFVVGVVDDAFGLTGIYKLIGQFLAVSLLTAGGYQFDAVSVFGWAIEFGDFSIPFTMFFCLGAINAFNLIDGSDALAGSVGTVVSLTLGVIAGAQGDAAASAICFALAGALAGFLPYNAPPARIYLGDTGSMMIGLLVAATAIHCSIKEQAAFALAVPIAVCAIPILDAGAALVRRITTGQSVFAPDRGHLHHALLHRGWTAGQTAAFVAGLTAITCGGALASYFTGHEIYALIAVTGVFAALAFTRVFGHAEVRLVAAHATSAWRTASTRRARRQQAPTEKSVQLQGRRRWEMIWSALREAAPDHNLSSLRLNVNIPRLHESFFATWKRNDDDASEQGWQISLPLKIEGRDIGRLQVGGCAAGAAALVEMQQVLEFLEPLDDQLRKLMQDVEEQVAGGGAPARSGVAAYAAPAAPPITPAALSAATAGGV